MNKCVRSRKGNGAPQIDREQQRPGPLDEMQVIQGGLSRKGWGEGLEMGLEVNRGQDHKRLPMPCLKPRTSRYPGPEPGTEKG